MTKKELVALFVMIQPETDAAIKKLIELSSHEGVKMKKQTVVRSALDFGLAYLLEGAMYVEGVTDKDVN